MSTKKTSELGSFRDPSGQVYYSDGQVRRDINFSYQENYRLLIDSGLYKELSQKDLLVPHLGVPHSTSVFQTIQPSIIPFISYPYEWCFSALQRAALLTLDIAKISLRYGMSLKDASAFNVQFIGKKPIFIDTLSFEKYVPDQPWVAYRQFCQHFLAPLALMAYTDVRLNKLSSIYIDGIPLDIAAKLLPIHSKLNFGILGHIVLNAKSQEVMATTTSSQKYHLSRFGFESLLDNLTNTVKNLHPQGRHSTWGEYYSHTNYVNQAFKSKTELVSKLLKNLPLKTILDLGGNNGLFSKVAATTGAYVICADYDEQAIEDNFTHHSNDMVLPLVIDFLNPSPNLGWANHERKSFWNRANFDAIMMLATIHHLAIANNLPFDHIARLIKDKCRYLLIEFVGKEDSQVKILLSHRQDIFVSYNQSDFEKSFTKYFDVLSSNPINGSSRILYLMQSKSA